MTKKIGFPLALAIFLIIWFIPLGGLDTIPRHTLALMSFTIVLWITRPWMPALTGMLFMVLAWLLGLAGRDVAFSGLSATAPWFIWAALMLALALKETKLDLRIAYSLLKMIPASTTQLIGMHYFIALLLSYGVPSSTARVSAVAPLAVSQIESLGLPRKSNAGKMLLISLVLVNWMAAQCLVTGGSTPLTAWGVLQQNGIYVSWVQWWLYQFVPLLAGMAVLFAGCWLLFRPEPSPVLPQGKSGGFGEKMVAQTVDGVMVGLGPVSAGEKKVALLMLSTIAVWATEAWHGIDTDVVGITAGIVVLLPGVGVLQAKEAFQKIGWDTVIFVAAALSFGEVAEKTAVSGLLVASMGTILNAGHSEISFLMMLLVIGFLGRLLLRSGAANAAVLLIPAVQLAKGLGYNAALVGMVFPLCVAGIFIYQHAFGLVAYDYGTFEEPDFILACLVRYVALVAAIAVGYYLWWPFLRPL